MGRHIPALQAALVALTSVVSFTVAHVVGQTKASTSSNGGTVQRTLDGLPDLQGVWYIATLTGPERPAAFAGKATLTEVEAKAFVANAASANIVDGYQAKDRSTRANGRDITYADGRKSFMGPDNSGAAPRPKGTAASAK